MGSGPLAALAGTPGDDARLMPACGPALRVLVSRRSLLRLWGGCHRYRVD